MEGSAERNDEHGLDIKTPKCPATLMLKLTG
jgi:hypothetical protein